MGAQEVRVGGVAGGTARGARAGGGCGAGFRTNRGPGPLWAGRSGPEGSRGDEFQAAEVDSVAAGAEDAGSDLSQWVVRAGVFDGFEQALLCLPGLTRSR